MLVEFNIIGCKMKVWVFIGWSASNPQPLQ